MHQNCDCENCKNQKCISCKYHFDGSCARFMPDSKMPCDCEADYCDPEMPEDSPVIKVEGVGKDAEVVINEKGGKQSKAALALHLFDPKFLHGLFITYPMFHKLDDSVKRSIFEVFDFMVDNDKKHLLWAVNEMYDRTHIDPLKLISDALEEGLKKRYRANNWRLIPEEEHINHALIHFYAYMMGDTQDDHISHYLCRLMMAYATDISDDFSYTRYIPEE